MTNRSERKPAGPSTPCTSRRNFVRLSMLGGAAVAGALDVSAVRAWEKPSKLDAGYVQKTEPSAHMCASCHSFIDPDDCIIVEGPVSPLGYCNWYED